MSETLIPLLIEKLETRISEEQQQTEEEIKELAGLLAKVAELLPRIHPAPEPYYKSELTILDRIEEHSEKTVGSFRTETRLTLLENGKLYFVRTNSGMRDSIAWEFDNWQEISITSAVEQFGLNALVEGTETKLDEALAGYEARARDEEPGLVVAFKPEIPA
jgi:hypothetical protein